MPPPETLIENGEWSHKAGDDVEFSGAHQREGGSQDEQGQRSAEEALGGERRDTRTGDSGGHGGHTIVASAAAGEERGWAKG